MELTRYQPIIGSSTCNSTVEAVCGSSKQGDGCHDTKEVLIDSREPEVVSELETEQVLIDASKKSVTVEEIKTSKKSVTDEEIKRYYLEKRREELEKKQFYYNASRKSDWTDEELQQIFAKYEGIEINRKLTEREARATREMLNVWKDKGDILVLPFDEFLKIVFISNEELKKRCREVKEAREAKKQAKALSKLKIAEAKKFPGKPVVKDEKPRRCEVCTKVVVDHTTFKCPYLKNIPNPDKACVGKGYEKRCHCCLRSDHGHPKGTWGGFAFKSTCDWAKKLSQDQFAKTSKQTTSKQMTKTSKHMRKASKQMK